MQALFCAKLLTVGMNRPAVSIFCHTAGESHRHAPDISIFGRSTETLLRTLQLPGVPFETLVRTAQTQTHTLDFVSDNNSTATRVVAGMAVNP